MYVFWRTCKLTRPDCSGEAADTDPWTHHQNGLGSRIKSVRSCSVSLTLLLVLACRLGLPAPQEPGEGRNNRTVLKYNTSHDVSNQQRWGLWEFSNICALDSASFSSCHKMQEVWSLNEVCYVVDMFVLTAGQSLNLRIKYSVGVSPTFSTYRQKCRWRIKYFFTL